VCLNNKKQLTIAWHLYSNDNNDHVPNNRYVNTSDIDLGKVDNWVNNNMTRGVPTNDFRYWDDVSNTNTAWVLNGSLGSYTGGAVEVYRCPADTFLSLAQVKAGFQRRNRSVGMNYLFGNKNGVNIGDDESDKLYEDVEGVDYVLFLKQSSVPRPAKTWLFVDGHSDFFSAPVFLSAPNIGGGWWESPPASYHGGGCGFSSADGHSEIKMWRSATSKFPVNYSWHWARPFDAAGRDDFAWYQERTGYIQYRDGKVMFNY
jgi:hypothetical protein